MQLSPSASSASQSKVQPKYSCGIGVSGNHHLLYLSIDKQSYLHHLKTILIEKNGLIMSCLLHR
jgi:hypothetical protein